MEGIRNTDVCTRGVVYIMNTKHKAIKLLQKTLYGKTCWYHLDEGNSQKYYIFSHCNDGVLAVYDLDMFSTVLESHGYYYEVTKYENTS